MANERDDLVKEAEAELDKLPDGPEKDALRRALNGVAAGGSISEASSHLAEAAEASGLTPFSQLSSSVEALGMVRQMPGCHELSFIYGLMHGISMAVAFPEWARAFHLKEHPTEEEQDRWRKEHLKIVELTPMTMNHDPNPTGQ